MIIKKKNQKKIHIDLTGPDGNAFVLLATAKQLCGNSGFNEEDTDKILNEMTSSNYENLVQTLDKYFGSILVMER